MTQVEEYVSTLMVSKDFYVFECISEIFAETILASSEKDGDRVIVR